MDKLRMEVEGLKVESFETGPDGAVDGTVRGYEAGTCSKQPTCGVASRGEEAYAAFPPTRYACCV